MTCLRLYCSQTCFVSFTVVIYFFVTNSAFMRSGNAALMHAGKWRVDQQCLMATLRPMGVLLWKKMRHLETMDLNTKINSLKIVTLQECLDS